MDQHGRVEVRLDHPIIWLRLRGRNRMIRDDDIHSTDRNTQCGCHLHGQFFIAVVHLIRDINRIPTGTDVRIVPQPDSHSCRRNAVESIPLALDRQLLEFPGPDQC